MAPFHVLITPSARRRLNEYIEYIRFTLLNPDAADAVLTDALETIEELSHTAKSIDFSRRPSLRSLCCREIPFLRYDYVMIYRVKGSSVYIEDIYHRQQI